MGFGGSFSEKPRAEKTESEKQIENVILESGSQIGEVSRNVLDQYNKGENTKEEVFESVKEQIEAAMNTIDSLKKNGQ